MSLAEPKGCISDKPSTQTILFAGKYINQNAIARMQGLSQSYVSRILAGLRNPTVVTSRKLAAALGMSLEEFLDAIEARKADLKAKSDQIQAQYTERVKRENAADRNAIKQGRLPTPRMPGLRAS